MDAATSTERDAEEACQAAGDLAVREPALLVEFDDSGLGIGSQLRCGGAEGVGRLQGMTPLHRVLPAGVQKVIRPDSRWKQQRRLTDCRGCAANAERGQT